MFLNKLKLFLLINLLFFTNVYSDDILKAESISDLLKKSGWKYGNHFIELDIDGDGINEIFTQGYKEILNNFHTNYFLLKRNNENRFFIYLENERLEPILTKGTFQYSDGDFWLDKNKLVISYARGSGMRTNIDYYFTIINKKLILEKQVINSFRTSDGSAKKTEYFLLEGRQKVTSENLFFPVETCRPSISIKKEDLGEVCIGEKEYTSRDFITYQKDKKNISYDNLCIDFRFGKYKAFDCREGKQRQVLSKNYLYIVPNQKTKMYLIKGDKVVILDEQTDNSDQKWYFINYKGKNNINMWVKAEAVDITDGD